MRAGLDRRQAVCQDDGQDVGQVRLAEVIVRAAMARVPREIPAPAKTLDEPFARTTLAVDWTRRPTYAVVPQSGPSKAGGNILNWVDLYTGPLTWRIRDHAGLHSTIELLLKAHKTAIAVCPDVIAETSALIVEAGELLEHFQRTTGHAGLIRMEDHIGIEQRHQCVEIARAQCCQERVDHLALAGEFAS